MSSRDASLHLDRAIHGEILAGRGTENDAVYLDLSGTRRGFQPEVFVEYMHSIGIDLERFPEADAESRAASRRELCHTATASDTFHGGNAPPSTGWPRTPCWCSRVRRAARCRAR